MEVKVFYLLTNQVLMKKAVVFMLGQKKGKKYMEISKENEEKEKI